MAETLYPNESEIISKLTTNGEAALNETGLKVGLPKRGHVEAGHIVYLRHDDGMQYRLGEISKELSSAIDQRAITYTPIENNLHVTLGTWGVVKNSEEFRKDRDALVKIGDAVSDVYQRVKSSGEYDFKLLPRLEHSGIIIGSSDVLAKPHGGSEAVREYLQEAIEGIGLMGFGYAWGRHSSLLRVTEDIPVEDLEEFKLVAKGAARKYLWVDDHYGTRYATKIGFGTFAMTKEGFILDPVAEYSLEEKILEKTLNNTLRVKRENSRIK